MKTEINQITENFKFEEFKCKDGTEVPDHLKSNIIKVAKNLQALREDIGKPIKVLSGYRTREHNVKVGGSPKSMHLVGRAADIKIKGVEPLIVAGRIMNLIQEGKMQQGGIGIYKTFVHYDTRGYKARWINQNQNPHD